MTAPKPRLRGHTGIRVGAILSIVGVVVLVIGIAVVATQSFGKVDGFQRVSFARQTATVSFGSTGDYVAYYEAPGVNNDISTVPAILVQMRNHRTGDVVALVPYGNNSNGKLDKLTYNYHGHNGVAFRQFHISATGDYDVQVRGGSGVDQSGDVAFGESIEAGTLLGGGLVLVGGLLLLAGLIVLIVALVRRRGHKKELAAAYGYGAPGYPPPPPGYGGYPQQGYPQQGYPPQGYPPPGYPPPGYPPPGPPSQPADPTPPGAWQPPTSLHKDEPGATNPWPPKE